MLRLLLAVLLGFLGGAVVIEKKAYFVNVVPLPVASLPDGGEYEGSLNQGELHGQGRIVWPDGRVYEGEFHDGKFDGQGRLETTDFIYEGTFVGGHARGYGSIVFSDGRAYEGDVFDAKAHGYGLMSFAEGEYIGEFQANHFQGRGRLIKSNGDIYQGEFTDGNYHGSGQLATSQNLVYEGNFENGLFHGEGEYRKGPLVYNGGFKHGLFDGEGTLSDGENYYKGSFSAGEYYGVGHYENKKKNSIYKGGFEAGLFHGKGDYEDENEHYVGSFQEGQYHGLGELRLKNPVDGVEIIKGKWLEGELVHSDIPGVEHDETKITEHVLYHQSELLADLLAGIEKNNPNVTEMYFIGVAGEGKNDIHRRNVEYSKQQWDTHLGSPKKSLLLVNGNRQFKSTPLATVSSLRATLEAIAHIMDAKNDILLLHLSGESSRDGTFVLNQPGINLGDLQTKQLRKLLDEFSIQNAVIVLSMCYTSEWINTLKDNHSFIVGAASNSEEGFECTYENTQVSAFVEVFFGEVLTESHSFEKAFYASKTFIEGLEAKHQQLPSQPLIYKTKAIADKLNRWKKDSEEWVRLKNTTTDSL